jgi:ubiquinone/menaquinone biosynthesis C-methylase UbiE
MDVLQNKLRWLKPKHSQLVLGGSDHLPFDDASFDCVINSEVIESVPALPEIMTEMWRVLRPGGTLILGTPNYNRRFRLMLEWIYGKVLPGPGAPERHARYTAAGLSPLLKEMGYEVQDCRYAGFREMILKARKPALAAVVKTSVEEGAQARLRNVGEVAT